MDHVITLKDVLWTVGIDGGILAAIGIFVWFLSTIDFSH